MFCKLNMNVFHIREKMKIYKKNNFSIKTLKIKNYWKIIIYSNKTIYNKFILYNIFHFFHLQSKYKEIVISYMKTKTIHIRKTLKNVIKNN